MTIINKMANDRRGGRILSDLCNAFRRDPQIDEFDFIPVVEPKQNRSPVVLIEHKLGLELWSVKILYLYSYHHLMVWKGKESHRFYEPQELINLSRAVVLIGPECLTVWNIRKELIESGDLSLTEELKLSALVLLKHPKSSETFSHRKWVLSRYVNSYLSSSTGSTGSTGSNNLQDGYINMEAIDVSLEGNLVQLMDNNGLYDLRLQSRTEYSEQLRAEFRVCQKAAENYSCNYYAWSHRIWVLQHCHNCAVQVLLAELHTTESWVSKHVSDHSGFHYRQFLLSSLCRQSEGLHNQFAIVFSNLLQKEFHFISDLVHTYPGHEAMWNHRKYVFQTLYKLYGERQSSSYKEKDHVGEICLTKDITENNHQKKTRLELDQQVLEQKEIDNVTKRELQSTDIHQRRLADSYIKWIGRAVVT